MKQAIKYLVALMLLALSTMTLAWSGTVTSTNPDTGAVTTIHKDPDTGVRTITLPNGDVIIREPLVPKVIDIPGLRIGGPEQVSTEPVDITFTINTTSTVAAPTFSVIQPAMITSIGGGMSGGGGDIGSSASGQAILLKEIVLDNSDWIEDGVAFWEKK